METFSMILLALMCFIAGRWTADDCNETNITINRTYYNAVVTDDTDDEILANLLDIID